MRLQHAAGVLLQHLLQHLFCFILHVRTALLTRVMRQVYFLRSPWEIYD